MKFIPKRPCMKTEMNPVECIFASATFDIATKTAFL